MGSPVKLLTILELVVSAIAAALKCSESWGIGLSLARIRVMTAPESLHLEGIALRKMLGE